MQTNILNTIHSIASNVNYIISLSEAKKVLVSSDYNKEGKTTFLLSICPVLHSVFKKRVLIVDLVGREDLSLVESLDVKDTAADSLVSKTKLHGIDYISVENNKSGNTVISELENYYDVIFLNTKNYLTESTNLIPEIEVDGAFMIKSSKSLRAKRSMMSDLLLDKSIPILGVLLNEGAK